MALESTTYIDGLNPANPSSTDSVSQADDHLRLLKSTIKSTFPNVSGAVTKTHTQLNNSVDKAGDTMTGPLTLSGAPSADLHATTKLYVDTAVGAATGGLGGGTVTSVGVSGGSTGFAFSGSPVTSSGTMTMSVSNAATVRSALSVPSTTGSGASGTWGISISGNAATATSATTANTATTAGSVSSISSSVAGSAIAELSVGAVGSYAFLKSVVSTTFNPGATTSGSNLRYAGMIGAGDGSLSGNATSYQASGTPSGTWRCMGYSRWIGSSGEDDGFNGLTLWLRIS